MWRKHVWGLNLAVKFGGGIKTSEVLLKVLRKNVFFTINKYIAYIKNNILLIQIY